MKGRVVTRRELLAGVWKYGRDGSSRTVDNHIAALRRKLEKDPAHPEHIVTMQKRGCRFQS